MNKEENEAIKYLEFLINEKCECEACQRTKKEYKIILNLIERQQKEIEELMKICDSYKSASNHCVEIFSDTINPNYISKDKIREKIKNIKENIETLNDSANFDSAYVQTELEYQRTKKEILQELLEEN